MTKKRLPSVLALFSLTFICHVEAGEFYTPHDRHQRLGRIDLATGAGTDIGSFGTTESGYRLASGAFDVNGDFYSIALLPGNVGSQLARVDVDTGLATPIGPRGDIPLLGMEIDANGAMYATQIVYPHFGIEGETLLHRVDKATGILTPIGNTGVLRSMDMAFDSTRTLWLVGGEEGGNRLYTLDPTTGAATFKTVISDASGEIDIAQGGVEIMGIMFDEHDTLYATAFLSEPDPNPYESPLFTINTTTGFASVVGQTGLRLPHGGDYLVPEPLSLTIFAPGLIGLLLVRRRRSGYAKCRT